MPFVSGYLRIRGGSGHPDNELPEGEQEVDPGYGVDQGGSVDNELPRPPPGVFPPPVPSHPIVIAPPGVPPGTIWPPINPARPDNTLPGGQGGQIDNTLPGSQKFWVVVWIPGYGYKYVCVDPSLQINSGPAQPPASGNRPDNELPPTSAQPKKPI
jgi:hypothetical protein